MTVLDTVKGVFELTNLMLGNKVPPEMITRVFNLLEAFAEEGLDVFEQSYRFLTMMIRRANSRGDNVVELVEEWLRLWALE